MYESIPKEVKAQASFCLWRLENRNGRMTKLPYQRNGHRGNPADKSTFTDFVSACSVLQDYDGIGMGVFDGYSAVDIDHCVENGKLSELARDIVDTMDSYTEFSPSGNGIRIIFKVRNLVYDQTRYYVNNRNIGLEIYISGRTHKFVTLTGNALGEKDVAERNVQIMAVLEKYMVKPTQTPTVPAATAAGSYLTDEDVVCKAMDSKQGIKFRDLWNGDIPAGKSHSEADLALCSIFAFWCGGDMDQIDRLFRQSGLMRDKWERDDYRMATLQKAVSTAKEFYKPIHAAPLYEFHALLPTLEKLDVVNTSRYRSGDIGYGRLFADVYQDIARYVPERKKWYVYNGKRWAPDVGGMAVMEQSKELADALMMYALSIKEEAVRTQFITECRKWQQRRFREIYLKEAQSVYPITMERFDCDKYLFNCNNGTLDLRDGTFREHQATDLLTKQSPVDYDPQAHSPRFDRFIREISSGDMEKAKFLQKALGYGLSGDTRYECLFFLYGELTRNGKGTLMESCLSVLGDYGKAVKPETIAQKHNVNSQAPSEDLARLAGIRFANISEPGRGMPLNAAQVKSMTGNDTQNARFLNENSFEFKPQFKIYINTNYLPVISDTTLFSSGRVVIIPFNRHFEEWEQDKTLKEEFAKPEVQSAVLNWLVEGFRLLQQEGMYQPISVSEAIRDYAHESNKIAQFTEERLVAEPGSEVRTSAVYEAYRSWCYENGCYTENSRNFNHELRKIAPVERKRPQDGGEKTTLLIGYRLRAVPEFMTA